MQCFLSVQLASTVQYPDHRLLLLVIVASECSDLSLRTIKWCSVVFGVKASCYKHFVEHSHKRQMTLLTSDKCHQLTTVWHSCVYNTWQLDRWQHAMKPDIGRESHFCLPHLHLTEYRYTVWSGKTRLVWLPNGEEVWRYVYSFRQNTWTWRTDRQTRHRPRLCIALCGNNSTQIQTISDLWTSSW